MTPEPVPGADLTKSGGAVGVLPVLPSWFPPWARSSPSSTSPGTTAAFVLHGNTYDYVRMAGDGETRTSTSGWRSSWPSSCSAAGRWCCTTTSDAGCAWRPGATSSG